METIVSLFSIYAFIFLGWIAKKIFKERIDEKSLVLISIYFLSPILVFWGLTTQKIDATAVDAPFIFWIHDLSVKDPFYVLPVIMCLTMVAQQRFTPTPSADASQQKMMMFMPLIFGFFMKDLPAGLNLYIAVSTLFGIVQQIFVYRTTD